MGRTIIVEKLTRPTIEGQDELVAEVRELADCWMTPIKWFLEDETLPANPTETKRVKRQAPSIKSQQQTISPNIHIEICIPK